MNIAIIGGGISGLYCSNLLSNLGHNITIYENNKETIRNLSMVCRQIQEPDEKKRKENFVLSI